MYKQREYSPYEEQLEKRNKQLLTALKTAKNEIKVWYKHTSNRIIDWKDYDRISPRMQRINKAIKDGHNR